MAALRSPWSLITSIILILLVAVNTVFTQYVGSSSAPSLPSATGVTDLLHRFASEKRTCDTSLGDCALDNEVHVDTEIRRRVLNQQRIYISYGSLSADRVPCPPMSGRSYYTPNCNSAYGRANPYRRGCSAISRCRRDYS
ncbi:hypothetical protein O6H91_09G116400 [Diphasiastrum complanatum]|uniref:Uncharacterized protein n=1 Tax=Diphasiastrum complanatum TaxID=34168 RepID=A0ACC2CU02_DIPCM|nr:hypothetical protein O6H91_09G116400 [Diphasiastrum complanatum]